MAFADGLPELPTSVMATAIPPRTDLRGGGESDRSSGDAKMNQNARDDSENVRSSRVGLQGGPCAVSFCSAAVSRAGELCSRHLEEHWTAVCYPQAPDSYRDLGAAGRAEPPCSAPIDGWWCVLEPGHDGEHMAPEHVRPLPAPSSAERGGGGERREPGWGVGRFIGGCQCP